ncbi:MAG: hypothetical protein K6E50_15090 [Lachnospiraceae bacterium]|nr:hypothetical protein [Lachnospiraceae bacterium]
MRKKRMFLSGPASRVLLRNKRAVSGLLLILLLFLDIFAPCLKVQAGDADSGTVVGYYEEEGEGETGTVSEGSTPENGAPETGTVSGDSPETGVPEGNPENGNPEGTPETGTPEPATPVLLPGETFEEHYGIDTDAGPYDIALPWDGMGESPYKNDNAMRIFRFLQSEMSLHKAAAVGILTNIFCESRFRPDALGDSGTSYGICQWHAGRWELLKQWCGENGCDWQTMDGQLRFLKFEAESGYPLTMGKIRETSNNAQGAGESARLWCKNYEIPANTEAVSLKRRDMAIEIFWPEYKDEGVEIIDVPELIDEKEEQGEEDEINEVLPEDVPEDGIPEGIWFAGLADSVYDGSAHKPALRVYDHTRRLKEKTDYTLSYKDNKKAGGDPERSCSEDNAARGVPRVVVTMKGNYSGTHAVLFAILPVSVSEASAAPLFVTYNGKVQKPKPECSLNGKKLKYGKDFAVAEYEEDLANGWRGSEKGSLSVTLHIRGIGNYCDEVETTLCYVGKTTLSENTLPQAKLDSVKAASIPAQTYTGTDFSAESLAVTNLLDKNGRPLAISLTYKGKKLDDGDVEIVGFENALLPGTARIRLRGKNAYESATGYSFVGEKVLSFKIKGLPISKKKVSFSQKSYPYTGEPLTPAVTVEGLREEDYSVSYENNTDAGKAGVIITGRGIYEGTKKATFTIAPLSVEGKEFEVRDTDAVSLNEAGEAMAVLYEKGGAQPQVRLYRNGVKLLPGRDYTLSYSANKKPGAWNASNPPTIIVSGKGNYAGKRMLHFTIGERPFKEYVHFFAGDKAASSSAGNYEQKIILTDIDGTPLKQGTDYSAPKYYLLRDDNKLVRLTRDDCPKAGSVIYVGVTGMGGYRKQTIYTCYRIIGSKNDIAKAGFTITDQQYNGRAIRITSQEQFKRAVLGGTQLKLGEDFRVVPGSYRSNIKKGTASVTLMGIGEYSGQKTVRFKIVKRSGK